MLEWCTCVEQRGVSIGEVAKSAKDEAEEEESEAATVTANAFKAKYASEARKFHDNVHIFPKQEDWKKFHDRALVTIYGTEVPDASDTDELFLCKQMFFRIGAKMRREMSKTVRDRVKSSICIVFILTIPRVERHLLCIEKLRFKCLRSSLEFLGS